MPEIVLYGYKTSPFTHKLQHILAHLSLSYKYCLQPRTLPRPDLASLGVRYRRIPVLSIDGDMYCDTSIIISRLCELASTPNSYAYECVGRDLFPVVVGTIKQEYLTMAGEGFMKDRSDMIGFDWTTELQGAARVPSLAALVTYADVVEKEFLAGGERKFFEGEKVTLADLHVFYVLYWAIYILGSGEGLITKETHPVLVKWLDDVKTHVSGPKPEEIPFEQAKAILSAGKAVTGLGVSESDPTGLKEGDEVSVVPTDNSKNHPTSGKLAGLTSEEVCVKTKEGVRVHFPRLRFQIIKKLS